MKDANIWINGGYFVLRKEIFRYINPGEELVHEPFQRTDLRRKAVVTSYDGFWQCMDTFKDKQILEELELPAQLRGGCGRTVMSGKRRAVAC